MLQLRECPDGTFRAVFVLCSNESIAAHQRQINNSMMSRDVVLLRNHNVGNIYRLRNSTSCHDPPPCHAGFCVAHAVITGICCTCTAVEAGRSSKWCCGLTVCVWYVDGRRADGRGGGLPTNIHMRKKGKAWLREREGGRERTGIMASIQWACRVENQWGPKRKGKTEIRGDGRRRRMKGSVFILVQVSLFVKVVIFWRRKTFLQSQFDQGYSRRSIGFSWKSRFKKKKKKLIVV